MKLVSIIIPVYNIEKYIKKCIISVLEQTYKNLEIIIVNDETPDESINIIKSLLDYRCKIINKKNGGLSSARNYGLEHANGDYVFFLDGDDWINHNAIELLVNYIEQYNVDIVQAEANYCYDTKVVIDKLESGYLSNDMVLEYFNQNNFKTYVWNKLYKKEILNNIRFMNGYNHEDVIFTYFIAKKNPLVYNVSESVYNYVQRNGSIMNQANLKKKMAVFSSLNIVSEDCKNYSQLYYDLSIFNTYITALYLMVDCINKKIIYSNKDMNELKNIIKELKSKVRLKDISKHINKKNKIIYYMSFFPVKMIALIFNIWRKR